MTANLALGLTCQAVALALLFSSQSVRIERPLDIVGVLYEFQRDFAGRYFKRILASIPCCQMQRKYRMSPAPCLFQFLGIHGQDNSEVVGPHSIAISAIIVAAERAARAAFFPTQRGWGVNLLRV